MKKYVQGYEGIYTVDTEGNVFSVKTEKAKKGTVFSNGYVYVHLSKHGKSECKRVHRIVAEAFLPNPDHLEQINHINGIKTDNRVVNLEWCDRIHNMKHAKETGLMETSGENNPCSKLTQKQVEEIRSEYIKRSKQHGTVALAKKYNVSNVMIGKIVRNECWKQG